MRPARRREARPQAGKFAAVLWPRSGRGEKPNVIASGRRRERRRTSGREPLAYVKIPNRKRTRTARVGGEAVWQRRRSGGGKRAQKGVRPLSASAAV